MSVQWSEHEPYEALDFYTTISIYGLTPRLDHISHDYTVEHR